MRSLAALLVMVAAALRSCGPQPPPVVEAEAAAFADSVGVNTHLQFADTSYGDFDRVQAAMAYVQVRHIRDSAFRRGPAGFERFVALARAGVRFDLFFNSDLNWQLAEAGRLETAAPGALATLEGPNEVNNDPVRFAGRTGTAAAQSYQAALYRASKATPQLRKLTVVNYTNGPASSGLADAVNAHSYPKRGASAAKQLAKDVALSSAVQPLGQPAFITEFGYATPRLGASADGVNETDQAALLLVGLLDAFRMGVRRTYVYELLDERPDKLGQSDPEQHYGLFTADGQPKLAAAALGRLLRLLRSPGPPSKSPSPVIRTSAPWGRQLLLHKTDGGYVLLLWRETTPQTGAVRSLNLTIDPSWAATEVVDPVSGASSAIPDLSRLTVQLPRGPLALVLRLRS